MNNRHLTFEEELIRQAAERPPISIDLRSRVRAAAGRAAKRRLWVRRTCAAAFVLACFAGSLVWGRPAIDSVLQAEVTAPGAEPNTPEVLKARSRLAVCTLGEWPHVECFIKLRELQSQILRGAY
jgi:hypothetical protein